MADALHSDRLRDLRRLVAEPAAPAAAAEEDEYRAFASGRVSNRPQVSVTFAHKDGRAKTIAYSHFYCLDVENPNLGCVVEFTRHRVTLRGRNLAELARLLGDHKVREVRETDELHALTLATDAPVVTAVEVFDKRDEGGW